MSWSTFVSPPGALLGVEISVPTIVFSSILVLILGGVIGALVYGLITGNTLKRTRSEGERLFEAANREAETIREKAEVDAERKAIERRESAEKEITAARNEVREQERRLAKREDNLDRKLDTLTIKERHLDDRAKKLAADESKVEQRQQELDDLVRQQKDQLLHISGLSREEAREQLLKRVEEEMRAEVQELSQKIYRETEEEAKSKSREIIINAIQRNAAEFATDSTVRSIPIPSDDMKGRIIGREGRNIRAIERSTGVDVLVDDTPGVISVSCFDKIRQTIAAEALQRLIDDGRVHPTRIEEVVATVQKEVQERTIRYGKEACTEAKIRGLHAKAVEAMGKLYYRTSFGQNVLRHSIEVAYLSQIIADQIGLDGTLARRCGFLHDIGKAMDHEMEGGHPKIGMEFARKLGEPEEVLNAIGGHHADIPATSPYTPIVMAADAVSGARPGARRESMEQYIQRLEQLEGIAKENEGVTEAYAIQAGREVRIIVDADKLTDAAAFDVARKVAKRVSDEMTFPGEIKVTVLRETRAIEYAT
ncbi:MAG: ribonuclease Y [Planctomycetota bacterium]